MRKREINIYCDCCHSPLLNGQEKIVALKIENGKKIKLDFCNEDCLTSYKIKLQNKATK